MTKIIGHRGARGLAPENTLASLAKALEADVDEIEIDVRVTSDGVPVLMHNAYLSAPSGRLAIQKTPYEALLAVKSDLTLLEDAVRAVKRQAPLMIEVKPRVDLAPIVKVMQELTVKGLQQGDYSFASKSQRTLRILHQELPHVPLVVIERFLSIRARRRARQVGTRRISMNHHFLWFGFVTAMHRGHYELNVYTLNDPKKAARWRKHGLAGVITDYPNRFIGTHGSRKKQSRAR